MSAAQSSFRRFKSIGKCSGGGSEGSRLSAEGPEGLEAVPKFLKWIKSSTEKVPGVFEEVPREVQELSGVCKDNPGVLSEVQVFQDP